MAENKESSADTTIELFRTTIDAVGLDSRFTEDSTASMGFMLGVVPILILLVCVIGVLVALVSEKREEARGYGKLGAICVVATVLIYCPMVIDDSSSYSENPLRRTISMPVHADKDNPGPGNNTIVAKIHEQFMDELDQRSDGLDELGLDKECRTQSSLAGGSDDALPVLCGGYSLDSVTTDRATITPIIETSADKVWWPWSIDPHAVEVTARIGIEYR